MLPDDEIALLDGGVGQEIYHRSGKPAHPLWSAKVMMDQPQIVVDVHKDYIEAGADIITTNNYTVTPLRLARDGHENWFEKLHVQALSLANQAREESGRDVAIAGCIPPLIGSYCPEMTPDDDTCMQDFRRLVEVQSDKVDLFICETMPSIREAHFAITAALESGKPVILSLTVIDDDTVRLRSEEPLSKAVDEFQSYDLAGLLINCSSPESISNAMPTLSSSNHRYGGYGNGFMSVSSFKPGETVSKLEKRLDLDPTTYADYVMQWVERGATIIGGCCEISPAHIFEIKNREGILK